MDLSEIVPQGSYQKRKVGIDFGGYGPNCLGIRGQKGAKNNTFLTLCISCLFVDQFQRGLILEFLGFFDMLNLTMYEVFGHWAHFKLVQMRSKGSKIKIYLISSKIELLVSLICRILYLDF